MTRLSPFFIAAFLLVFIPSLAGAVTTNNQAGQDVSAMRTRLGLSASATVDTTNAANITSGNLSVLRLNGGTGANSTTCWHGDGTWSACSAGSVTSVAISGGASGLTFSGSPITTNGTLTLNGGALVPAYGGVPTGGTTGQALAKTSGSDYATGWLSLAASATVDTTNANNITSGTLPAARLPTTPSLVAGTNVTVSGTWPNQTINATAGSPDNVGIDGGTTPFTFSPSTFSVLYTGGSGGSNAVPTLKSSSYTLVLADGGDGATPANFIMMNCSAACILTVPPNASAAFQIGQEIPLMWYGAGQVTVAAGSGVTLKSPASLILYNQNSTAALKKLGTDIWLLNGNLQ